MFFFIKFVFAGSYHPNDLQRIENDDRWLDNFLNFHDYNVKDAFAQCVDTLAWRKRVGVNGMYN